MKNSLKKLNSFGVESFCNEIYIIKSYENYLKIKQNLKEKKIIILGEGTNILFKTQNLDCTILKVDIEGIKIIEDNDENIIVSVGAGVNWDDFVSWCVKNNYGGVENLTLIPGNVGSAPIQNIGAYGSEIKDVIYSCEGFYLESSEYKVFNKNECEFEYRSSIFKQKLKNKFLISKVNFRLSKKNHRINTSYKALSDKLIEKGIKYPSITDVSNLIKEIRECKLPNYNQLGNAGSFFKNPVLKKKNFEKITNKFSSIPFYKISENEYKLPAAWLIEKCGFKDICENKVGVYKNQSLVIINKGGATGSDIYNFSQKIKQEVRNKFDILLEEEVNII